MNVFGVTTKSLVSVLLLTFCVRHSAYATAPGSGLAGDLDLSFDSDGKVASDFSSKGFAVARPSAIAIQTDGKIIVAGNAFAGGNSRFALARYNINGSLDTSFGSGGLVTTHVSAADDSLAGIALQSDGKIVAAGGARFSCARFAANGTLDATFGSGGKTIFNLGTNLGDDANAGVAIQSDGKILIAGTSDFANVPGFNAGAGSDFVVIRLNSDGSLDNTFGTNGITRADFGSTLDGASAIALQSDGKIVVVGFTSTQATGNDFALVRFNSNGSLDTSFGNGGKVTTDFGDRFESAGGVAIQSDGKIVVAGDSAGNFALARYNSNGSLDTTFSGDGKQTTNFGTLSGGSASSDNAGPVAIQADGKIVVVGSSNFNFDNGGTTTDENFAVARYNSNGSLDISFSGDGKLTTDFTTNTSSRRHDNAGAVAIQKRDGRIVAAGTSEVFPTGSTPGSAFFAIARYHGFVCNGNYATILLTGDFIGFGGTSGRDVIVSLGANQKIDGAGGDDVICAPGLNNILKGGDGSDILIGSTGSKELDGGTGTDTCVGGSATTYTGCETITIAGSSGVSGAWDSVSDKCHPFERDLRCKLKGTIKVFNPRTATTGVPFFVAFYLSSDGILGENDTFLKIDEVPALDGGDSKKVKLDSDLVTEQEPSGKHVIAVLDFFNDVPEANENDNVVVSPPLP